jgi:actin cytoskeleton-regulatory complex protein PAN1
VATPSLLLTRTTAFSENVVISAHPSKTGSDWWYGTLVSSGKAGFFPKTYVQAFETGESSLYIRPFHFDVSLVKAKGLYDYQGGNADDLPFSEGDMISVVDRSDSDWYKAEKDGVIFSVPAAYLEIVEG